MKTYVSMRLGALCALLVALTSLLVIPAPVSAAEPIAPAWAASCAQGTVPFETQAWWSNDFGHVHAGFCAPQGRTLTGKYSFNVTMTLHDNPGTLTRLQVQLDGESLSVGGQQIAIDQKCPVPGTCSWTSTVTIDTAKFPYDGWHQIRLRAKVLEPDGKELIASTFVPVYFANGKPRKDYSSISFNGSSDYVSGRGWYTNAGYVYSVIFDPRSAEERVRGIYKVSLRPAATDTVKPMSRFIVKLDATHDNPGTVLYDTTSPSTTPTQVSIDTTKLANGWHSLLARTESAGQTGSVCSVCSGQPQTHAGVTKVWFYVQN